MSLYVLRLCEVDKNNKETEVYFWNRIYIQI